MANRRAVLGLLLAATVVGSVTTASAAHETAGRPPAGRTVVVNHVTPFDGPFTTLFRVDDRLVLVLHTPRGVVVLKLPNIGGENHVDTIQDSGDPIGPLGVKDQQPVRSIP